MSGTLNGRGTFVIGAGHGITAPLHAKGASAP